MLFKGFSSYIIHPSPSDCVSCLRRASPALFSCVTWNSSLSKNYLSLAYPSTYMGIWEGISWPPRQKFFVNPQKTRSALYRGPPNYPSIYMGVLEATFYPPLIENFCKTSKNDPFSVSLKKPPINKAIQRAYSCPLLAKFFIFVENSKKFCAAFFCGLWYTCLLIWAFQRLFLDPLWLNFFIFYKKDKREAMQVSRL